MKATPRCAAPVSIHLERHRCFMKRHLKTETQRPDATASEHGTPRPTPSDPCFKRSVVLAFERHDGDE